MNEKLIEALRRWTGTLAGFEAIQREEAARAEQLLMPRKALFITGIRRAGKSYLAKMLSKNSAVFVNGEDPLIKNATPQELFESIIHIGEQSKPKLVFVDEAQNIGDFQTLARNLLDYFNVPIIVTGSSSAIVTREISSLLSGRYLPLELFPLSFRDYLHFRGIGDPSLLAEEKLDSYLESFMEYGSFPEVALNMERANDLLLSYFSTIVVKDVKERYNVREGQKLEMFARILAENPSTLLSIRRIGRNIGISAATAEKFAAYFEEVYFITLIPKCSPKTYEPIKSMKKLYLSDTGFHALFYAGRGEKKARVMENTVAIGLFRRYGRNNIFYQSTPDGYEVDFLVREKNQITQMIQVAYDVEDEKTMKRELRALDRAAGLFKSASLLVITRNKEGIERLEGREIRFVKLWKWLLQG
ncbi:ATP-binding protein [Candidatus Micrarchaeota archaeon]|nr:ATP-binding protein [Candidatus Micrarchaeota archaeon]